MDSYFPPQHMGRIKQSESNHTAPHFGKLCRLKSLPYRGQPATSNATNEMTNTIFKRRQRRRRWWWWFEVLIMLHEKLKRFALAGTCIFQLWPVIDNFCPVIPVETQNGGRLHGVVLGWSAVDDDDDDADDLLLCALVGSSSRVSGYSFVHTSSG